MKEELFGSTKTKNKKRAGTQESRLEEHAAQSPHHHTALPASAHTSQRKLYTSLCSHRGTPLFICINYKVGGSLPISVVMPGFFFLYLWTFSGTATTTAHHRQL
ncbi:unnamed protein product [Ectocarpus sp. 4 AP-2014]